MAFTTNTPAIVGVRQLTLWLHLPFGVISSICTFQQQQQESRQHISLYPVFAFRLLVFDKLFMNIVKRLYTILKWKLNKEVELHWCGICCTLYFKAALKRGLCLGAEKICIHSEKSKLLLAWTSCSFFFSIWKLLSEKSKNKISVHLYKYP